MTSSKSPQRQGRSPDGNITSHRARSAIALQPNNVKEAMTLFELQAWLGHGSPEGPDLDGYPYSWLNLELVVTRQTVIGLWIRLWPGSTTKLPPLILPDSEAHPAAVLRDEFLTALEAAGGHHEVNPTLTFGEQSSVITDPGQICAVFGRTPRLTCRKNRPAERRDVAHGYAVPEAA